MGLISMLDDSDIFCEESPDSDLRPLRNTHQHLLHVSVLELVRASSKFSSHE